GHLRVDLGQDQIALAPARERTGHHDAAIAGGADGGLAFVADERLSLPQQRRPDSSLLSVGELLLVMCEGRARRGERRAADVAVLVLLVLVGGTNGDRGSVAPLMRDAE